MGGRGNIAGVFASFSGGAIRDSNIVIGQGRGGGGGGEPVEFTGNVTLQSLTLDDADLQRIFDRRINGGDIARAVGAPDGSIVQIELGDRGDLSNTSVGRRGDTVINVSVSHPYINIQTRQIFVNKDADDIRIENIFYENKQSAPSRTGFRIFSAQVAGARALGASSISTTSIGTYPRLLEGSVTGYYVWAVFGYNAKLPSSIRSQLPKNLRRAKDLNTLMSLKGGRRWWLVNGRGMDLKFDLNPNSTSSRTLRDYASARNIPIPDGVRI